MIKRTLQTIYLFYFEILTSKFTIQFWKIACKKLRCNIRPVGKIYTITEYIWKTIEKGIYNFLLSKNNTTSQAPNSPSHLKMWVMYFRHRYSMNLLKNWIDSTIVESYQCSQDRSHTILIRLGSYFQPWLCPF